MKKNEEIVSTDGNFLDEMLEIERSVLMEIDPDALKRFEEEGRKALGEND